MDREAIKRLENNHYALEKAIKRLNASIDKNDEQEIYAATGETLLWVLTTEEWHKKHNEGYKQRKKQNQNGLILFGLLHAYNSVKHNMNFIQIHKKEGGFQFPMEFPLDISPITVNWTKAGNILDEGWPVQKENYEKYIQGKEVLETIQLAMEFLKSESEKYINKV